MKYEHAGVIVENRATNDCADIQLKLLLLDAIDCIRGGLFINKITADPVVRLHYMRTDPRGEELVATDFSSNGTVISVDVNILFRYMVEFKSFCVVSDALRGALDELLNTFVEHALYKVSTSSRDLLLNELDKAKQVKKSFSKYLRGIIANISTSLTASYRENRRYGSYYKELIIHDKDPKYRFYLIVNIDDSDFFESEVDDLYRMGIYITCGLYNWNYMAMTSSKCEKVLVGDRGTVVSMKDNKLKFDFRQFGGEERVVDFCDLDLSVYSRKYDQRNK